MPNDPEIESADTPPQTRRPSKALGSVLWLFALALMTTAVFYQRMTGPTYPKRGELTIGAEVQKYKLIRSKETTSDALVILPDLGKDGSAELFWRRYPTKDEYVGVSLTRDPNAVLAAAPTEEHEGIKESLADKMFAPLPKQPSAGKLEYYLELNIGGSKMRIPEAPEETIIIRYKDPVPWSVLGPHIFFMFFSVLIGMRCGLSALFQPRTMRRYAWTAFVGMTAGGMVLGPFVQKYAFGKYWTGFPWGYDLTDNKMLIMWLAWIIACSTIGLKAKPKEGVGRFVVLLAAIIMTVVYSIPHSMKGSELDYSKLDEGVSAEDAIGTGKK